MKPKFKVGDIVTAFGLEGVIEEINAHTFLRDQPMLVDFGNGKMEAFHLDGKIENYHKEPSLKLVRHAEEFEEVVGYQAVIKHDSAVATCDPVYETKESALAWNDDAIGYREVKYMRRKV